MPKTLAFVPCGVNYVIALDVGCIVCSCYVPM
jgi:hypothetical protein